MTDKINKTEDISEEPQTIKFYSAEEELFEDILNIETEEILAEPDLISGKSLRLLIDAFYHKCYNILVANYHKGVII